MPAKCCVEDPPARWVRSCVELPGYARGWIPLPSPSHSTMLYTMMQVDRSPEDRWFMAEHPLSKHQLPYGRSLLSYRVEPV